MAIYKQSKHRCAFSRKQQSAYGTPLAITDITESIPFTGDHFKWKPEKGNDSQQAGKGHKHPTEQWNTTCNSWGSQTFDASSYSLAHTFAFACGSAVPSVPVGTTGTHEYLIKPVDIPQLPCFTLVDSKAGTLRLYPDVLIKSFTLSGNTGEQLKLTRELIGSGRFSDVTMTMPSLVKTSFLRFSNIILNYGGTEIQGKLKNFNFKFTNNVKEGEGYNPGSGNLTADPKSPQVRSELPHDEYTEELSFKLLVESTALETDMIANTVKSLVFTAVGSNIEGEHVHKLVLNFPEVVLEAAELGVDNGFFVYDIKALVLWNDAIGAPFEATFTTNTAGIMELPA